MLRKIVSKLPDVGTTIFTVMTNLANEHGAINLAQGFPDYPAPLELIEHLATAARGGHNQYAPMRGLPSLCAAIAEKYNIVHDVSVDPETQITITPGGTSALFTAIAATVRTGDEVIIFEPAYDSYAPAILVNGGVVRPSRLRAPYYTPDWDNVRSLINDRTVMIIVNTPHNPTGTMWAADDIDTLAALCENTRIVVLSDEVYELVTFDGRGYCSLLAHRGLAERTFVVTSFGKTYHVTGWKVGACVASAQLTTEFRKVHQFLSFSVHTPTQFALAAMLSNASSYLSLRTFFQAKRDLFASMVEGSAWTIRPCSGSYFQLLGYENITREADLSFARRLTIDAKVASTPLSPFYSTSNDMSDTVLRFCFAKTDETLKRAAEQLCRYDVDAHT
ncbi:MAG: methionine aminotransferase [bacterium]|nr:methionine aminotransferase [bacterium]